MADPRVRQLTIKSGVLKRLTKEKVVYEQEVDQQRERIVRLQAAGKDEHTMRKEDECLQESLMMVPNTQRRLAKAFEDLSEFIKNEDDLKQSKEYELAIELLAAAKLQMA